ncbi:SPOR domain-containing protein [uncultured Tateyamaria sp.]|uniref:SPOR domain-containing protein n=1 Tax=uncultured Tateyamaria sp. TaxID=455651 RepID=UPI002606D037|nr:SPOR domain-containing protein [uncultured Tateyamaria sp.]
MADMQFTHHVGHVGYTSPNTASETPSNPLKNLTNLAGAAVSLALIAGVSVWGYKLVMRDVSGIPVVRAAEGEMRIRPSEPGGQLAQNTGLAVNEVAAVGEASGPVDRLVLAPRPMDLSDEDLPMTAETVAPVQQPEPLNVSASLEAAPSDVLATDSVEDLVNQLTAGVDAIDTDPIEADPIAADPARVAAADIPVPTVTAPAPTVTGPGPSQSRRPQLRPKTAPAVVVPVAAIAEAQGTQDLDATTIPTGTRLVQLGAFDSPEIAREQWDKMQGRFGDYLKGKDRIVQQAQSGGRTFYRLRAHGFADLSDARRFCSALVAEGADCIPVVTR